MVIEQHVHQAKNVGDVISISTVIATLGGYLPAVAAVLSIVWTSIRIHETETMKKFYSWIKNKL